ncbi:GNAT family N-acetyltransferase [Paramaledivibacter caminithermalis]|jgi:RimJ/RimL family protein N-acetyltransferase|uniref:Protein N-acetyltransferase, RimJ/RimL family n=1 Tax=Paramaledivibacter caminithermalis (strain DSM 15212 / CIP 107654 / DViRD3) TaxID=1121301 RepID=A0A1M6TTL4_PARC5|nr:GNAT family protein [Paramaledivibacter caminithermalis]SHK60158.1 Protein N-acetyltransferase, RimJ/RimL family [Paramaledivibacter caminithermalis DSM 15212]
MYYKKIIGNKCYLSPINVEDYQKYTTWVNDMEVGVGMLFTASVITEAKEKEFLEGFVQSEYNFAIVDKETDNVIGNVGFPKIDKINHTGEIGIFIGNKDYWGKGYGTEAIKLILDFGFSILNLHNIHLKVYEYNKPAIKCYKKVGFKEVGRLREAKQIAGKRYDEIYMDILASEYESVYIKDLVEKRNK